jgi:DNA primase
MSCVDELMKIGVMPKIIRLENNMDPDEFILKFGKEKFLEKIDNPINVMDFKLSYLKDNKDISKSEELANYVNNVIKELGKIEDEVLKEITLRKLSTESNLDINFLKERLTLEEPKKVLSKEVEKPKEKRKLKGYELAERNLIYYMLLSKDVIKVYDNKAVILEDSLLRALAREISAYYHKYNNISMADFISYASNYENINKTLNEILNLDLKDDIDMNVISDYVDTIRKNQIEKQIKRLTKQMEETTDEEYRKKLASRVVELNMQKLI